MWPWFFSNLSHWLSFDYILRQNVLLHVINFVHFHYTKDECTKWKQSAGTWRLHVIWCKRKSILVWFNNKTKWNNLYEHFEGKLLSLHQTVCVFHMSYKAIPSLFLHLMTAECCAKSHFWVQYSITVQWLTLLFRLFWQSLIHILSQKQCNMVEIPFLRFSYVSSRQIIIQNRLCLLVQNSLQFTVHSYSVQMTQWC